MHRSLNRAARPEDFTGQAPRDRHPLVTEEVLAGQHPQRGWEYGQALRALEYHIRDLCFDPADPAGDPVKDLPGLSQARIVDVGGASSNFWQPLRQYTRAPILRIDPALHGATNTAEYHIGAYPLAGWRSMDSRQHDAVFCLSVLEHIPPDAVPLFLADLAALVAPGGLLCLSCDYADGQYAPYHFAPMRHWMPEPDTMAQCLEQLGSLGFSALDAVDLRYYGPTTYNYSLLSLALVKHR